MVNSAYTKDILRTIRKGKKRFFSFMVITMLGVMMFSGLQASCMDLRRTADAFFDEQHLQDLEIVSTLGLTEGDVAALDALDDTELVEGIFSKTVHAQFHDTELDIIAETLLSSGLNTPYLTEGRMPEKADEVVVSQKLLADAAAQIGDTFTIREDKEEVEVIATDGEDDSEPEYADPVFTETELTIVGVVIDTRDINNPFGATSYRSSQTDAVKAFMLKDAVDSDVYTSVALTLTGSRDLFCFGDTYETYIRGYIRGIEADIKTQREEARYRDVYAEAEQKIDDAEQDVMQEIADAEKELSDAEKEFLEELADAEKELSDAEKELADAAKKLRDAERELANGERELNEKEAEMNAEFKKARKEIRDGREELDAAWSRLNEAEQKLIVGGAQLEEGRATLREEEEKARAQIAAGRIQAQEGLTQAQNQKQELETSKDQVTQAIAGVTQQIAGTTDPAAAEELQRQLAVLQAQLAQVEAGIAQCDQGIATAQAALATIEREEAHANALFASSHLELEQNEETLQRGWQEVNDGWREYEAGKKELDEGEQELNAEETKARAEVADARQELAKGRAEINSNRKKLLDGYAELEEGKADYEEGKAEGEQELADAKEELEEGRAEAGEKIADAREKLSEIDMATWYVRDRDTMSGYNNIRSDADSIEAVGAVFPLVFFVVAILVSLTTVTRMVDEDRGLIGTYKALGFKDHEILRKYLIYVFLAGLAGSLLGTLLAFLALPAFIFVVFGIMYLLPSYSFSFVPAYGLTGPVLFLAGIGIATQVACRRKLQKAPATLMRPKTPRAGSRVLLEHITPLWTRLSFLNKVTARNLFRYKKRLLMTIFGIAGCMALLLFGFSIKDSVNDLPPRQYGQTTIYDALAVSGDTDNDAFFELLDGEEGITSYLRTMIAAVKLQNAAGKELSATLVAVPDADAISDYVLLSDMQGHPLTFADGDVLVTYNAGDVLGFDAGDLVTMQLLSLEQASLPVAALCSNYLGNYVYMTRATYEMYYPEYEENGALILLDDSVTDAVAWTDALGDQDGVRSVSGTQKMKDQFNSAFLLMNVIVYIVIGMSAALAFVVLFTLSTTNISERERELATIKVLGFYDREVHLYVDKETLILTLIGILLGIPLGYAFAQTLTLILRLPSIQLAVSLHTVSYVFAAALTLTFAFAVNVVTDRILNRIDPVEALKSVE